MACLVFLLMRAHRCFMSVWRSFASIDLVRSMESSRPSGRCERFLDEDNLVRGLDGESISFGTDEHELLGLIGLAAPAISDGSAGEKVISYEDFVLAFDLAFEPSKEGVLDG